MRDGRLVLGRRHRAFVLHRLFLDAEVGRGELLDACQLVGRELGRIGRGGEFAQLFAVAALGAVVSLAFAGRVDATLGRTALAPGSRAAISRAKRQPLGSPSLTGVPPGERVLLRATFDDASVHAFRLADTIAAVLVAGGGLIALAGIRDPRRRVAAELCPAGALCGASQELVSTGPA